MSRRSVAAIIVALVVFMEIIIFAIQPTITTTTRNDSKTLFGNTNTVINHQAMDSRNMKFAIIIGATILAGGIVVIATPGRKSDKGERG